MSNIIKGSESERVSALDVTTHDLIREVSIEALDFYTKDLSGLYLPEDFKEEHKDCFDVEYWTVQKRLRGKFGRFLLKLEDGGGTVGDEVDEVLLMGTTIGVDLVDSRGNLQSLRHFEFRQKLFEVFRSRGLDGGSLAVGREDYGSTHILLDDNGDASAIEIGGRSIDYGRADEHGRRQTCELFKKALGDAVSVINKDPVPEEHEFVIRN